MNWKKAAKERLERARQYKQKGYLLAAAESAPGGIRGTAFHESAHAVVAELFAFPVDYLTIEPRIRNSNAAIAASLDATARSGRPTIAVSLGGCQLVLDENGKVPFSTPFRAFCYGIGDLASIPAEKRLKIPATLDSFFGDLYEASKLFGNVGEELQLKFLELMSFIATGFVSRPDVWAAITEAAETVLLKKTIQGEELRAIVRKYVTPDLFTSEETQARVNDQIHQHGPAAILGWAERQLNIAVQAPPEAERALMEEAA
jgi:hypothetical protein